MLLAAGASLGPYRILSLIGSGGMGEVYKATDTRLDRLVAIKVLPSADAELRARFEREARAIAALSHPHICTLHDVGRQDDVDYLVMEYLEGETLGDRISKDALPLDQALVCAIEIAEALERAHRAGIVHRDLKPGNIMLTKAGAKLLDFGLAKLRPAGSGVVSGMSTMATTAAPLTGQGSILGTLHYMSPEQLDGQDADARSDIFSFGAVLYEMVTGKKAFEGKSQASLIGAIMSPNPRPMTTLQPSAPPALDRIVRKCVAKEPAERWQSMEDVIRELRWTAEPARPVTRFAIALGPRDQFSATGRHIVALSPDGTRLAYAANDRLYLRELHELEPAAIPGTEGAGYGRNPFFSPDGQWIGFWQDGQLKKIPTQGGDAITICKTQMPWGAEWNDDGSIVFGQGAEGIWRVPDSGGAADCIVRLRDGAAHGPHLLPGTNAVLFTLNIGLGGWDGAQIVVQTLDGSPRQTLIHGGTDARYVPTGHLIYVRAGTLFAVGFDPVTRTLAGAPAPMLEGVSQATSGATGAAQFSVARQGSMAYVSAGTQAVAKRALVWVDRQGREEPINAPARAYQYARLSPDGARIALDIRDQEDDIWVWDVARDAIARVTFDKAADRYPVWSSDSRRLVYSSARAGGANLFWQSADGTGTVTRLTESPNAQYPTTASPDGIWLLYEEQTPAAAYTKMLALDDDRESLPLVKSLFAGQNAEMSPDGRWLIYQSAESGKDEIYARPFPDVMRGCWQVSKGGGLQPAWSRSGTELFYLSPAGAVMSVRIAKGNEWTSTAPVKLFEGKYYFGGPGIGRTYDVSPDGQRFLMIKPTGAEQTAALSTIVVVQNWFEELKRLALSAH
jgi:serine/threonine-protein kinase